MTKVKGRRWGARGNDVAVKVVEWAGLFVRSVAFWVAGKAKAACLGQTWAWTQRDSHDAARIGLDFQRSIISTVQKRIHNSS